MSLAPAQLGGVDDVTTEVDVVVVGLGPGGEKAAAELAEAGLVVVAVDENLAGGECRFYGCTPTKMMVRAADLLAEARRVPGVAGESLVSPSWTPVAHRITTEATHGWDDQDTVSSLESSGVSFVRGRGRLAGPRTVEVGGDTYVASRGVILATGTSPGAPDIPGLAQTPYWTNRDAVQVTDLPKSLIVVGGGPVGVELCQVFARFGVSVTLLEVADRILAPEEPESSQVLSEVFEAEGIRVLVGVEISAVAYNAGCFSVTLPDEVLDAETLLVTAGRRTNLDDLGLETVGLDPTSNVIETDAQLRAGEGLWAVGDITGKGLFTHVAVYQAQIVTKTILDEASAPAADYRAVPRVTYTDPEVASVGLTEQQAREQGLRVRVGLADMPGSSRGWLHGRGSNGLVKVVEDASRGVLVGASAVGPCGGELLAHLTLAVHARIPTGTLASMVYAFPTFHEVIRNALDDLH